MPEWGRGWGEGAGGGGGRGRVLGGYGCVCVL